MRLIGTLVSLTNWQIKFMLDRTIQPTIKPISKIIFPEIAKTKLSNGLPLHYIHDDSQEVLRVDFMFGCGIWQQSQPMVAALTAEMLREGTASLNSQQIAEKLDFYGSWLQLSASYHYSYLTVYSLCKYLPETLSVIEGMLKESIFPEPEFKVALNKRHQQYLLDNQKVQNMANKRFSECMYGSEHPYGKTAKDEDFKSINTDLLKAFYKEHYHAGNCQIILSGQVNEKSLAEIEQKFGGMDWWKESKTSTTSFTPAPSSQKHHKIDKADSVQAAVRIGRVGITRKHADYHGLKVLNTVLGGYFGSRLMSTIREEKGYTYGIGSGVGSLRKAGSYSISTQCANEYVEPLIKEVYNEMALLRNEQISEEELSMVRNYLLGENARAFDGTFSIADAYLSLLANDLPESFFQEQLNTIRSIDVEALQALAIKYFQAEEYYEIIAG